MARERHHASAKATPQRESETRKSQPVLVPEAHADAGTIDRVFFFANVQACFEVADHGCVIVLVRENVKGPNAEFQLKVKSPIQLRRPDGQVLDTYVEGFEMASVSVVQGRLVVRLPQSVTKSDAPKGTQVWVGT